MLGDDDFGEFHLIMYDEVDWRVLTGLDGNRDFRRGIPGVLSLDFVGTWLDRGDGEFSVHISVGSTLDDAILDQPDGSEFEGASLLILDGSGDLSGCLGTGPEAGEQQHSDGQRSEKEMEGHTSIVDAHGITVKVEMTGRASLVRSRDMSQV